MKLKIPTLPATKKASRIILFFFSLPILLLFVVYTAFNFYFSEKIFPGVSISGIDVGSKTKSEALKLLKAQVTTPEKIDIKAKEKFFQLSLPDIGFRYDIENSVNKAFVIYRTGNPLRNFKDQILSVTKRKNQDLQIDFDQSKLSEYLQVIASEVANEPVLPSVRQEGQEIVVEKGLPGEYVNADLFLKQLNSNLSSRIYSTLEVPFSNDDSSLNDEQAGLLEKRAEKFLGKNVILKNEYDFFNLAEKDIFPLLDGKGTFYDEKMASYIEEEIVPRVNREPQNAVLNFQEGKVIEFRPSKSGLTVNTLLLSNQLVIKLNELQNTDVKTITLDIPVETKEPEVTTDKVNDFGIKELLGRGTSKFKGSIPGRIHNVGLASSNFNGVLIPPGSDFSFNETLGDVSVFTGYKQAYVIRDGKTVLGDGGGVCQVSTTFFRAILNAGLPITERHAHSYRVGYYEQDGGPGLDATVFSPTTDLKFKNDSPAHLLVQTIFDAKNMTLVFEIYGTSDGRKASITKPVILSSSKPPDDLYIDDPTLPAGQIKQTEHKAWGAKVSFDYKVERNGETLIEKKFLSAYRPWGAVFLRGTGNAIP